MSDPTDADKARMSKVIGKFDNIHPVYRVTSEASPHWLIMNSRIKFQCEDDAWLSLGFFFSRDALWPVLEKLAETEERLGLFLVNLARTMPDNGKTYAPDDYVDLDLVAMLIQATPAQLALAAYKTIAEMKEEKNETD